MFESIRDAFDLQSDLFDEYEEGNEILKRMRASVREHLLRHLRENNRVLEINAGTGSDAVFLAERGYNTHATDISEGMLKKLKEKIDAKGVRDRVTFELLSFTELDRLGEKDFDYIFSNFGGLNCTGDLSVVTKHFKNILTSGGKTTLVVMPPVCPWEIILALKGRFKQAFRRLHAGGVNAHIEGVKFKTYYHGLRKLKKTLSPDFKLIEVQGLSSVGPPPYAVKFAETHPRLCSLLERIDKLLSHVFPFDRWADHYIATFELTRKYNPKKSY